MKTEQEINAMREAVMRYDMAVATKIELEAEIASLETDLSQFYMRPIKQIEASVEYNNGYPHILIRRRVLNLGEVAAALLPVLKEKLREAQKQIDEL